MQKDSHQPELTLPEIETTEDGSPTLYTPAFEEHYHSTHGAVQESQHIYLQLGLATYVERHEMQGRPLRLVEMGFGTGLNALLTLLWAGRSGVPVEYHTIERYPIPEELAEQLDYRVDGRNEHSTLQLIHRAEWGRIVPLTESFQLQKYLGDIRETALPESVDVVYYDAFSPESQPELWEEGLFARLYAVMRPGAVLTTYCAKGEVRRRLQRVGFLVERLPGPPGKREVLRATKPEPSHEAD